jgi:hypothetical protein
MTITKDDPRYWDVRTLERRLRKGQITKKDIAKHANSLPDSADKAAPADVDAADDDDDDDEDDVDASSAPA